MKRKHSPDRDGSGNAMEPAAVFGIKQTSAPRYDTSSSRRPTPDRLPKDFLPESGQVKVRPMILSVRLYLRGPFEPNPTGETDRIQVGKITWKEDWREYSGVSPKMGLHYLRILLTEKERGKFPGATHGWALFEDTSSTLAHGKDCRRSRFFLFRKPIVLLSLFDGIGGARVALESLPSHFQVIRAFSSEVCKTAKAVSHRNFTDTIDLGDIRNIDQTTICRKILGNKKVAQYRKFSVWDDELHFVIIAGPPCQDLSQAKAKGGRTKGVFGRKSQLFFHVPRILWYFTKILKNKRILHFIVENVEMAPRNMCIFGEFLGGTTPWKIDFNDGGCCASLMSRRRIYWSSMQHEGGEVGIVDFLRSGCAHPARKEGKSLEDVLSQHNYAGYEYCNKENGQKVERLGTLTRFAGNVGQEKYYIRRQKEHSDDPDFPAEEAPQVVNEILLGFPSDHTKYGEGDNFLSDLNRRKLLG